jgi:hypothetical protein
MSSIEITTGQVIEGDLPKKALAHVLEWLDLYKEELNKMWETQKDKKLPPLV